MTKYNTSELWHKIPDNKDDFYIMTIILSTLYLNLAFSINLSEMRPTSPLDSDTSRFLNIFHVRFSSLRLPVVSYSCIFRIQTFRTHFRSVRTQPSGRFVPNKLWHKMFKTNINIYFIYPSNPKTIKMHSHRRKVYVWSCFLHCWTLLNIKSVSGPRKVSVTSFDSLKPEAFTVVRQLHRGKLDSQNSLALQMLECIYALNQNKQ